MSAAGLEIVELYNGGMAYHEVAEKLGVPTRRVYSTLYRAKQRGIAVRHDKVESPRERRLRIVAGRPVGLMTQMLETLDEPVLSWLMKVTPQGMSVAEYVAAMVLDAYHEEVSDA